MNVLRLGSIAPDFTAQSTRGPIRFHEWIGDGFIGHWGFSAMVCHPKLAGVPVVTEMPGEVPEKDEVNVARLKAMRDAC